MQKYGFYLFFARNLLKIFFARQFQKNSSFFLLHSSFKRITFAALKKK